MSALATRIEREAGRPLTPIEIFNITASRETTLSRLLNVTVEQLTSVLSTLPIDLTFVDADDRVAFFTEGPDRIFARSKAIIGRKAQHCHPPSSVDVVDHIQSSQGICPLCLEPQNNECEQTSLAG